MSGGAFEAVDLMVLDIIVGAVVRRRWFSHSDICFLSAVSCNYDPDAQNLAVLLRNICYSTTSRQSSGCSSGHVHDDVNHQMALMESFLPS